LIFTVRLGRDSARVQIGDCAAAASAVLDGHLNACKAVLLRAVVVVGHRQAGGSGSVDIGVAERILVAGHFRYERTIAAAIDVGAALPALLSPEIRQDMRIGPIRQALRGPAGIVGAVAAGVGHCVDRRGAADHLAARALDASPAEPRNRLGLVHPVVTALPEDSTPTEREMDPHVAVPSAGLEHEYADILVFRQSVCQRAAG
jgi:hypothetical protein